MTSEKMTPAAAMNNAVESVTSRADGPEILSELRALGFDVLPKVPDGAFDRMDEEMWGILQWLFPAKLFAWLRSLQVSP